MATRSKQEHRLSGWSRLWIVATAVSWIAGAGDLAMSPAPLQWPPPFGDLTPSSARLLLWFLAPLVVAIGWIATRWVWRGFLPRSQEGASSHMTTMDMARESLRVLVKVGIVLIASALAIVFAVFWFHMAVLFNDAEPSIWRELSVVVHTVFGLVILSAIWEAVRGLIVDAPGGNSTSAGEQRKSRRRS